MKLFGKRREEKRKETSQEALEVVLRGGDAPSFPQLVMRILRILRDPQSTMDQVSEAIQWDPGLMVRVLATVNSAAYGPAKPIDDVAHAASYMGRAQLEQIVLALAVRDALPATPAPGYDAARYWRAAAFRAALAKDFADRLHPARHAESFTVGLLQDLAVPVLANTRSSEYGPVLEHWHNEKSARLDELENDTFGWNHGEVGALLAHHWELPSTLTESIQHHHDDGASDREVLPATRLVSILRETEREHGIEAVVADAQSDYGLAEDWTRGAIERAEEQSAELAKLLS